MLINQRTIALLPLLHTKCSACKVSAALRRARSLVIVITSRKRAKKMGKWQVSQVSDRIDMRIIINSLMHWSNASNML